MKAFIFIWDVFRKFPFLLAFNTILLVVVSLFDAASLFSVVPIVDILIKPDLQDASAITLKIVTMMDSIGLPTTLGSLLAIFLMLNVMRSGVQICATHLILRTKYVVLWDIMRGTFEDFFNARWHFFSGSEQGKLLNTFMREMTVVGDAFGGMARFFAYLLQTTLYFGVPFYISWRVSSISLVTAILFSVPFMLLGKLSYRLGRLNTCTANRMGIVVQESLSSAKIILGFANQQKSFDALNHAFDAHRQATLKSQTLGLAIPLMYYPLGIIVVVITILAGRSISLPFAELTVLIFSLLRTLPIIGQITAQKTLIDNFFPSYEQVMDLRRRAQQLRQQSGSRIFTGFDNEISIDSLCFSHPGHKPTLLDITVRLLKGKMVAFVGDSGAGKSTLIDMIMGFNEPSKGQITVDAIPIQEFDIKSYRKRIGYVPQDSILFNMSITDNLLWAKEAATNEEIKEACRQANAHEFIEKFPDGYDTLVGDRGVRLSGGQLQRIALARAILVKPSLLILDEATSSLDTNSERLIQQAVDNIAKQTTVIVIAHRLSTIVNADHIYVLREGRIVEEGTYSALVTMNGYFNRMVKFQAMKKPNLSENYNMYI